MRSQRYNLESGSCNIDRVAACFNKKPIHCHPPPPFPRVLRKLRKQHLARHANRPVEGHNFGAGLGGGPRHSEWQWQGGSNTNRRRISVRFEWYKLESGSGSIGRVAVCFKIIRKKEFFIRQSTWHGVECVARHGEWQWLGGSGTNRRSRSRRFEWYKLESGSDSIDRVTIC
jgi:hypothetical protein